MIVQALILVLYVFLINWNMALYNMALTQKDKSKFVTIGINILVSIVLGYLSLFY